MGENMAADKIHLDVPCPMCNFIADEWFYSSDTSTRYTPCPMCGYDEVAVVETKLAPVGIKERRKRS
jgi:hypothetical protein